MRGPKRGGGSELTFIVLVLTPLVSFLLSLSISVSLSPSFLSTYFQYILFYTINFHLSLFCPRESVPSTHSTPKMICMQQSYVQAPQGPQGLTTGHRGCQLGEWSYRGCACMGKAGALHLNTCAGMCFCHMLEVSHLGPISRV